MTIRSCHILKMRRADDRLKSSRALQSSEIQNLNILKRLQIGKCTFRKHHVLRIRLGVLGPA